MPGEKDYRVNLVSVPSCDVHNSHKARDDEYMFVGISGYLFVNLIGKKHFDKRTMRVLKHQKPLLARIAATLQRRQFGELEVHTAKVESERVAKYLDYLTRAIFYDHFRSLGEIRKLNWPVFAFCPSLFLDESNPVEQIMWYRELANSINTDLRSQPKIGSSPEIFTRQLLFDEGMGLLAVRMEFYEGFVAMAIARPSELLWQRGAK